MFDINCAKCKGIMEVDKKELVRFCMFCGSLIPISAKGEQPFHFPEKVIDLSKVTKSQIVDINKIIKDGVELPPDLLDSLEEASEILKDISDGKGFRRVDDFQVKKDGDRKVYKFAPRPIPEPEKKEADWDQVGWFDKLKKL